MTWSVTFEISCDWRAPWRLKEKFYRTTVKYAMLYGSEYCAIKNIYIKMI